MANYPGVHISEKKNLSLSNNGMSGLHPLLVGRFYHSDGTPRSLKDGVFSVSNWLEFSQICHSNAIYVVVDENGTRIDGSGQDETASAEGADQTKRVKNSRKKQAEVSEDVEDAPLELLADDFNPDVLALRHFFDNGGGACSLLSIAPDDNIAEIPAILADHDDISLYAAIGSEYEDINSQLDNVLRNNPLSFLVASNSKLTNVTFVNNTLTAQYGPDLITGYQFVFSDDSVWVRESADKPLKLLSSLQTTNKELYKTIKDAIGQPAYPEEFANGVTLPAAAAVAGAYCRNERQRGIWKAPANIVLVNAAPTMVVTPDRHGSLNEAGINLIVREPVRGTVIMGARTGELPSKTAWRYVPVRLLFNAVERDIRQMMLPVVFEPNSQATWQSVTNGINNYLYDLWRKGGLFGTNSSSAWQVDVGFNTMSDADFENGILRVRIGLAALSPAEFIEVEFSPGAVA
ncbi:phage tail sheath C-terminal domain-containing protein [Enterobacter bugandensis]|uniref:phage tail sheath C-terminal domain-containing protein n=1 Tax=Enterobacter bugandensis TaxID=881260 RepID=UPI002FD19CAF